MPSDVEIIFPKQYFIRLNGKRIEVKDPGWVWYCANLEPAIKRLVKRISEDPEYVDALKVERVMTLTMFGALAPVLGPFIPEWLSAMTKEPVELFEKMPAVVAGQILAVAFQAADITGIFHFFGEALKELAKAKPPSSGTPMASPSEDLSK
jgi:hypothetical protein